MRSTLQLAEKLLSARALARRRLRRSLLRVPRGGWPRLRRGHPEERVARRVDGPRRARAAGRRDRLRLHREARLGRDEARRRDRRAIASGGGAPLRRRSRSATLPQPLRARQGHARRRRHGQARSSSSAPPRRRTRTTSASSRSSARFAEEIREILVVTSDGKLARDVQPLHALRRARHRRARRQAPGGQLRRRRAHDDRLLRRQVARVARARGGASRRS